MEQVKKLNDCLEKEKGKIDYKLLSFAVELIGNTLLRLGRGAISETLANTLLTVANVILEVINGVHGN